MADDQIFKAALTFSHRGFFYAKTRLLHFDWFQGSLTHRTSPPKSHQKVNPKCAYVLLCLFSRPSPPVVCPSYRSFEHALTKFGPVIYKNDQTVQIEVKTVQFDPNPEKASIFRVP